MAEIVYFIGCAGSFQEVDSTRQTLDLLHRLVVNYILIDEVRMVCSLNELIISLDEIKKIQEASRGRNEKQ